MRFSNVAFYLLITVLGACDGKPKNPNSVNYQMSASQENKFRSNETYYFGDIRILTKNNLPVTGFVLDYHDDGSISSECYYINGIRNGVSKYYYKNGTLSSSEGYKDGELHGEYVGWYENSRKSYQTMYSEGKRNGRFTSWYEDGKIMEISHDKEGLRKGMQCRFSADGTLLYEVNLKNGNGQISYVDPETKRTITENYENGLNVESSQGKVISRFFGSSIREAQFENGQLVASQGIRIDPDGKETIIDSQNYLHGLSHGKHIFYRADGKPSSENSYYFGQYDGVQQRWYENGQLQCIERYNRGILLSKKCWDESGKSIECECYNNNGVKIKCP